MAPDAVVELGSAIQSLREQLARARREGWYEELGFEVEPVELTIQAVVDKSADGKIGWGVLSAGGDYETSTTHTIKMRLIPVRRKSDGTVTHDFTISDQQPTEPVIGKHS